MRIVKLFVAMLVAALALATVVADEGGYKEPATGKVWSADYYSFELGGASQNYATDFAANYEIWDYNSQGVLTLYNDWRLPTLNELKVAFADGTLTVLAGLYHPGYTTRWAYSSSDTKGQGKNKKAYTMVVTFENGVAVSYEVTLLSAIGGGNNNFWMIRP